MPDDPVAVDDELIDSIGAGGDGRQAGLLGEALAMWRDTVIGAELAAVHPSVDIPEAGTSSMVRAATQPVTFGIDVSRYQSGINLAQVAREGFQFVIAKISQGSGYRSPDWSAQRDGTRAAGMLLAGYHYVTTDDPAGQAANCASWIGDTSIPVALDWERDSGGWDQFLAVANAFRDAGLHVALGYLPRWYWQEQGSPDLTAAGMPLWASRYPSSASSAAAELYRNVTDAHWAGYGGLTPAVLQFTDRAQVAGMRVDADAFRGTRDQLAALLYPPDDPGPGATGEDPMSPILFDVAADGSFRATTVCEAGASSTVVARAWIVAGITWGSGDVLISFLDDNGIVMPPHPATPGQVRAQVANNKRLWAEAPSGAVLATVEGRITSGAQIAGAIIALPK
jgi:hypothetical protein